MSFPFPDIEAAPPELLGLPLSLRFSLPAVASPSSSEIDGELDVVFVAPNQVLSFLEPESASGGTAAASAQDELAKRVGRIVRETGMAGLAVAEVVKTLQRRAGRR